MTNQKALLEAPNLQLGEDVTEHMKDDAKVFASLFL